MTAQTSAPAPVRHDWSIDEVRALYHAPLMDLVFRAAAVHRAHHDPAEVQVCKLISIKTGGCPEDCSYCSQSAHHKTAVAPEPLMATADVLDVAAKAKSAGVTRVCMGAAWRSAKDNAQFDRVLEMVRGVAEMGLEVCCTLGMLTAEQAKKLEDAGLYAYNHNLDTSAEFYEQIITTRTYADRLDTIKNVRTTDVTVCSGGILGLGEGHDDRVSMLHTLATMSPHPESVPVNVLCRVDGTPLADNAQVPIWDVVRMIAAARLLMPASVVRLSAGRGDMSVSDQALCFMAGANSIFSSDTKRMLTLAKTNDYDADKKLLTLLGLRPKAPDASRAPREAQTPREAAMA